MKYIVLPLEKVVKYDAKGFAYLKCPVCETKEMNTQYMGDNSMVIYCNQDNIQFRFNAKGLWEIDYTLFALNMFSSYENQKKDLKILFAKGLITYVKMLDSLHFASQELPKAEKYVLRCEMKNCNNPGTETDTYFNGFEEKTIRICKDCLKHFGEDS